MVFMLLRGKGAFMHKFGPNYCIHLNFFASNLKNQVKCMLGKLPTKDPT